MPEDMHLLSGRARISTHPACSRACVPDHRTAQPCLSLWFASISTFNPHTGPFWSRLLFPIFQKRKAKHFWAGTVPIRTPHPLPGPRQTQLTDRAQTQVPLEAGAINQSRPTPWNLFAAPPAVNELCFCRCSETIPALLPESFACLLPCLLWLCTVADSDGHLGTSGPQGLILPLSTAPPLLHIKTGLELTSDDHASVSPNVNWTKSCVISPRP